MGRRSIVVLLFVLSLVLVPGLALAQSAIQGVVKDVSGGVLQGVTVEATSPVLIEGVKSTTTDGAGQYRIIDLRPGVYAVTFTLDGFETQRQESLIVSGEQTRTVNAELKLGAISVETMVVGTAPTVDISTPARVTTLDRQVLDNLPTGNNIWEIAQLIPGINVGGITGATNSAAVGGAGGAVQSYMTVHGMSAAQNVMLVDGMTVSGLEVNGAVQAYFNPDMHAEVSYQTSGISADRSGGGVTVNMIPREGGDRFSGNARFSYRPHDWIADNNTQRIKDMGLNFVGSLDYLADEVISQGGPIVRNKLWFFGSYHQFNTSDFIANSITNAGTQAADDQEINQGSIRITWQASARNRVSGSYEKTDKTRSNDVGANDDPETAANVWTSPNYSTGNVKLTSTITPRLLFEGGFSFNREYRDEFANEGIIRPRFSPEWFANPSTTTNEGTLRSVAPSTVSQSWPGRDNYQASLSYVTGAHQIKVGGSFQRGTFFHSTDANADLTRRFDTATRIGTEWQYATPIDVVVRNTPVQSRDRLKADIGIYAQDSWRIKRLTLNAGLRWEHVNAQNDEFTAPEGRFVPARTVPAVKNVPDWYDWAPRFSVVYDLFGNARTAVKYAANRYNRGAATLLAFGVNTLTSTTRTLNWIDDGDGIPQGQRTFTYNPDGTVSGYTDCVYPTPGVCEIDLASLNSGTALFGTPAATDGYQGFPRTWNFEQLFEVQHALTSRLSITGSYTRGSDHDLTKTVNQFRQEGDYVPVTIYNPIDGTPITAWSIKDAATRTRLGQAGANVSYVEPERSSTFYQYAVEFRLRPYAGAQVFGGISFEREDSVDCVTSVPGFVVDPNALRFCDEYNLSGIDDNGPQESEAGLVDRGGRIPFAKDFRLGVSLPLPWYGLNLGLTYLNNDENQLTPTYTIVPGSTANTSTQYPDGNPAGTSANRRIATQPAPACPTTFGCVPGAFVLPTGTMILPVGSTTYTVNLLPGGRVRAERLQQVDLKLSKTFRVRNISVLPTLEAFNLFNADKIYSYGSLSYATSAQNYLVPSGILQSRIIGVGVQVRW